jgi:hypothetical protein
MRRPGRSGTARVFTCEQRAQRPVRVGNVDPSVRSCRLARRARRAGPARRTLAQDDESPNRSITRSPTRSSPAPLLRLRGRAGRRRRSPPQPRVSLPLRRPERGAAEGAPSSAQGRLPILSVCAKAWQAPSPRAVSALQSDGHARRSRRSGAGARQAPAEPWLHGLRRPLRRSLAPGMQLQDIRAPDMRYEQAVPHERGQRPGTGARSARDEPCRDLAAVTAVAGCGGCCGPCSPPRRRLRTAPACSSPGRIL